MGIKATTLDEQIAILRGRNMVINDEFKAKEILFDIGYYRLGVYWFPFELSYPQKHNRNHNFKDQTLFEDAVKLYYFDFNLRNLLIKALSRIEIAFRTKVSYIVSNHYKDSPTWFVDTNVVSRQQASSFYKKVYKQIQKDSKVIALHHSHHINDKYAPAWKTLEFMTLGEVFHLYKSLKDEKVKEKVSNAFGIKKVVTFENYLNLIKDLRNSCAHGNILYDYTPDKSIRKGPAMFKGIGNNQNLNGGIRVILYMMKQISQNRFNELISDIDNLIKQNSTNTKVNDIIMNISGLKDLHKK